MQPKRNEKHPLASMERQGFSLIELMAVLAILAILATIQYSSYVESVRKAKRAEGRTALMQTMQQQERYYTQNGSYIAFSSADPNGYTWFSGNAPMSSSYEIAGSACKGDTLQTCISLAAMPGTHKVNAAYKDDICGELTLTSNGIKAATGHGTQCW